MFYVTGSLPAIPALVLCVLQFPVTYLDFSEWMVVGKSVTTFLGGSMYHKTQDFRNVAHYIVYLRPTQLVIIFIYIHIYISYM